MTGSPRRLNVEVPGEQVVTARFYEVPTGHSRLGVTLVLGHGAGNGQISSFMVEFATNLSARGLDVMTFDFLYMARGQKMPDSPRRLEDCYRAAIVAARTCSHRLGNKIAIGGKSLGGRIASQVVADSEPSAISNVIGLVFLGYPLHPPGKPSRLRTAQFAHVKMPMLFLQGARDAFGTPMELRQILSSFVSNVTVHEVEGGDHSFKVLKRSGFSQNDVYSNTQDVIVGWLSKVRSEFKLLSSNSFA
jgi:predicted alpha/beta-hydrolase family hydrolase